VLDQLVFAKSAHHGISFSSTLDRGLPRPSMATAGRDPAGSAEFHQRQHIHRTKPDQSGQIQATASQKPGKYRLQIRIRHNPRLVPCPGSSASRPCPCPTLAGARGPASPPSNDRPRTDRGNSARISVKIHDPTLWACGRSLHQIVAQRCRSGVRLWCDLRVSSLRPAGLDRNVVWAATEGGDRTTGRNRTMQALQTRVATITAAQRARWPS